MVYNVDRGRGSDEDGGAGHGNSATRRDVRLGGVADHHYAYWPGMPYDASTLLFEVAAEFGVRFVLLRGGATKVRDTDVDPPPQARPETLDGLLASVERDVQRFHQPGGDAMRKVVLAPTTPTWSVHVPELKEFAVAAVTLPSASTVILAAL